MKFERNMDPKEAAGIGIKANAPKIYSFFIEDSIMDLETGILRTELSAIDYREIPKILSDIEHEEITADNYHFEVEPGAGDGKLQHLSDYKGKYVKCLVVNNNGLKQEDFDRPLEHIFLIPME